MILLKNFWATLKRYKVASVLNIIGLSIAFAAFAVIMMQVQYDLTYDKFHSDADRIFRVETTLYEGETPYAIISRPFARALMNASTDIERGGIIHPWNYEISVESTGENTFSPQSWVHYTPDILQIFDFQIVDGDTTRITEPNTLLISQSIAEKYFPGQQAVGKQINREGTAPAEVIAVYKDFPDNSMLPNDIYEYFGDRNYNSWSEWSFFFFVQLSSADKKAKVEDDIHAYSPDNLPENRASLLKGVRLTPLAEIHFTTDIQADYMFEKASKGTTYTLLFIAILIVLIAAINFINFSTSMVPLRIRSVNTQRVLGNPVGSIRASMIYEALGLSVIALIIAYWLVYFLSTTSFTSFLNVDMSFWKNRPVLLLMGGVALGTGCLAGLYPAFYITSFPPALVLKGSYGLTPKGVKLRTALISFQYLISLVLIMVALFIRVQNDYMKSYPLGFKKENILTFNISQNLSQRPEALKEELFKNPSIEQVAFADGAIVSNGKMGWGRDGADGTEINFDVLPVSPEFIDLLGLHVIEGRSFGEADNYSTDGVFLFNETARSQFGLSLESRINGHTDEPAEIAGFVRDFHFKPLQYGINPLTLYVFGENPWRTLRTVYVRTDERNIASTVDFIRQTVMRMDPKQTEVQVDFLDASIGNLYEKEDKLADLITLFSGLAIAISLIGVFGLILFETQYRRKEIGIRKINGATIAEILALLNRNFVRIVLVCFVIAVPVSYFVITKWLEGFAYKSAIHLWIFVAALLIVMLITLLTVTGQSYRAATENPVKAIKAE